MATWSGVALGTQQARDQGADLVVDRRLGELRHERGDRLAQHVLGFIGIGRHVRAGEGVAEFGADEHGHHEPGGELAQLGHGQHGDAVRGLGAGQVAVADEVGDGLVHRRRVVGALVVGQGALPPVLGVGDGVDAVLGRLGQQVVLEALGDVGDDRVTGDEPGLSGRRDRDDVGGSSPIRAPRPPAGRVRSGACGTVST